MTKTKMPIARGQTSILHRIVSDSPNLAESTRKRYGKDLDEWIGFASADPNQWTPNRAQDFYRMLLDRGLKPQSANRCLASVKYASSWLAKSERNEYLDFAKHVRTDDVVRRTDVKPLTEDEASALILQCSDKPITPFDLRDRALIVVGLETGMRRMSLIGMQLEGIGTDPDAGYPIAMVPLKGMREQLYPVPLSNTALRALEPWRVWLSNHQVRRGPVFCQLKKHTNHVTPIRHAISDSMVNKMIAQRATDCGIQKGKRHIHPHLFRHTFLSWRGKLGLTPLQIASVTGHKLAGLGALEGYIDKRVVGESARNSTPQWLAELVEAMVSR